MSKEVATEITHHQDRINAHKKGYLGPGIALLGMGIVLPHLGILETPETFMNVIRTGSTYICLVTGVGATAMGVHEIGVETGRIVELQRLNNQPPTET